MAARSTYVAARSPMLSPVERAIIEGTRLWRGAMPAGADDEHIAHVALAALEEKRSEFGNFLLGAVGYAHGSQNNPGALAVNFNQGMRADHFKVTGLGGGVDLGHVLQTVHSMYPGVPINLESDGSLSVYLDHRNVLSFVRAAIDAELLTVGVAVAGRTARSINAAKTVLHSRTLWRVCELLWWLSVLYWGVPAVVRIFPSWFNEQDAQIPRTVLNETWIAARSWITSNPV